MELHQLRCFVAAAEELHFGRAAQRLEMLPSALGRHIRLLEENLGTQLIARTTRNVALTDDGVALLDEAKVLIAKADSLETRFRAQGRTKAVTLKIGAIDTASAGLIPMLLHDFRARRKDVAVQLQEEKTIKLLPRLLSGRLDLAFIRPPENADKRLEFFFLFHETAIVAVPVRHKLSGNQRISIEDLVDEPLIVPERRSRPHSHDATMKLFAEAGLRPTITQIAEEKQTIVSLVAANMGLAIVPRWISRMVVPGVRYIPLKLSSKSHVKTLPLAAAWIKGSHDSVRDEMITMLRTKLKNYAEKA